MQPTNSAISDSNSAERIKFKWIHSILLAIVAGTMQYVYWQILSGKSLGPISKSSPNDSFGIFIHILFGFGVFIFYLFVRGLIKPWIFFSFCFLDLLIGFLLVNIYLPDFDWIHLFWIWIPITVIATWYKYPLFGYTLRTSLWLKNLSIAIVWSYTLLGMLFFFIKSMKGELGIVLYCECLILIFILSTISDWFDRTEDLKYNFKTLAGNFTPIQMTNFVVLTLLLSLAPGMFYYLSNNSIDVFLQQLIFSTFCMLLYLKTKDSLRISAPVVFDLILLVKTFLLYAILVQ